jgi:hypothetical protein
MVRDHLPLHLRAHERIGLRPEICELHLADVLPPGADASNLPADYCH